MAELNVTNIPAPRVPFIDERTGLMAREWYRFFLNLFVLTGSGSNPTSLDELQIGPPNPAGIADLLIQINKDIQGVFVQPVVQTGTIANYNLDGSPTAGGVAYGTGPALAVNAAGTLGQVLTSAGAGVPTWSTPTTGTVTSVSVVSANGLAGTVANATTTPAITLSTSITGVLKGNGTAISAAVSGTDIKTVNGTTLLGSGDLGTITYAYGGTGLTSYTAGDIIYASAANTVAKLAIGTSGQRLVVAAGLPSWATDTTIGTVTSVAALTLGTTGTDLSSTVANSTTTPVITLQVPTASASNRGALSAADWTTFNNKGSGTVTSVSVVSANGLAGTVANATTTPAITLTTSITGILKGDGTAISAAVANTDYVPLSTVLTKTADYTITGTDTWIINNKTGSTLTLTFPAASAWAGRYITVKNLQAQTVESASSNIVPIGSAATGTAILLGVVGNWATMVSDGINWVIMQTAPNNSLLLE